MPEVVVGAATPELAPAGVPLPNSLLIADP
jgi:hypothetical protein